MNSFKIEKDSSETERKDGLLTFFQILSEYVTKKDVSFGEKLSKILKEQKSEFSRSFEIYNHVDIYRVIEMILNSDDDDLSFCSLGIILDLTGALDEIDPNFCVNSQLFTIPIDFISKLTSLDNDFFLNDSKNDDKIEAALKLFYNLVHDLVDYSFIYEYVVNTKLYTYLSALSRNKRFFSVIKNIFDSLLRYNDFQIIEDFIQVIDKCDMYYDLDALNFFESCFAVQSENISMMLFDKYGKKFIEKYSLYIPNDPKLYICIMELFSVISKYDYEHMDYFLQRAPINLIYFKIRNDTNQELLLSFLKFFKNIFKKLDPDIFKSFYLGYEFFDFIFANNSNKSLRYIIVTIKIYKCFFQKFDNPTDKLIVAGYINHFLPYIEISDDIRFVSNILTAICMICDLGFKLNPNQPLPRPDLFDEEDIGKNTVIPNYYYILKDLEKFFDNFDETYKLEEHVNIIAQIRGKIVELNSIFPDEKRYVIGKELLDIFGNGLECSIFQQFSLTEDDDFSLSYDDTQKYYSLKNNYI